MQGPKLNAVKRRHLVSAYAAVRHMCLQMEEAARDGRSPTGVGAPLSPLLAEQTEAILAPVRTVRDRLHAAAQGLAPKELAYLERPQSTTNTVVWLSNLLDRVRVAVDDLQPSRLRRYGAVEAEEKALFEALHEELSAKIVAARRGVDRLNRADKAPADGSR
jgi:hypothetical protein